LKEPFLPVPEILNSEVMASSGSHVIKDVEVGVSSHEGRKMIAMVVTLKNGWIFGINLFEDTIFEDLNETISLLIMITILVMTLSGYAFYRVGQSITGPIIALADSVNGVENADYEALNYQYDLGRLDEVGHLNQAIHRMIERIRNNLFFIQKQNESLKAEIDKNEAMRKKIEIAFEALSSTDNGILIVDSQSNIIYNNQSLLNLFSFDAEAIEKEVIHLLPDNYANVSFIGLRRWRIKKLIGKQARNIEGALQKIGNDDEVFLITFKDITSDLKAEDRLKELRNKDILTGVCNRYGFEERVKRFLENTDITGGFYPLILINIDHFRSINDSVGFERANAFLKNMAAVIQSIFGDEPIIARTNGDEFAVFITEDLRHRNFEEDIRHAVAEIGEAYEIDGETIYFSFSAGVSVIGIDANYCSESMNNAHSAMNYVKERSDVQLSFFNQEMMKISTENYQMVKGLREAISAQSFEVFYQPKWDIETNRCVGFEALARWRWHGEYVRPDVFIRVAEYNNIMLPIGEIIFEKTATFVRKMADVGHVLPVSVNVSSIQFSEEYFETYVFGLLEKYQLKPEWIQIELTESILMHNRAEVSGIISRLKKKGVLAAIDDFGKGYSSLSYLKDFEVDTLKIDRDFIKDIPYDDDGSLAELIVNLGKLLNINVVAEGIEQGEQLERLASYGCTVIQGYYISKPMPEEDVMVWLKENS
ncbi:MAG: GGDEF domain-containing protein, partial [Clostridia bacterium]|nr:GGDEF domain-containing protein [Clostridia bacterium]